MGEVSGGGSTTLPSSKIDLHFVFLLPSPNLANRLAPCASHPLGSVTDFQGGGTGRSQSALSSKEVGGQGDHTLVRTSPKATLSSPPLSQPSPLRALTSTRLCHLYVVFILPLGISQHRCLRAGPVGLLLRRRKSIITSLLSAGEFGVSTARPASSSLTLSSLVPSTFVGSLAQAFTSDRFG